MPQEFMRLATFIETASDDILQAAVTFARTIPALSSLDDRVLRDHLPGMLQTISADLRLPQSRTESITKSQGEALPPDAVSSAQTHGVLRAQLGLTIEQLVAEYRALRSSVLRLWAERYSPGAEVVVDIIRFNEAIDQAVAESVEFFAAERERWRQIFLGVLGHDLRGPLNAIALTVEVMNRTAQQPSPYVKTLLIGVRRLTSLLDSLLEYSRANMGVGMALQEAPVELSAACLEELVLVRAANPNARIEFSARGKTQGRFDASRVREALSNLVTNAVKHGNPAEPTSVDVHGDERCVRIAVENAGDIPPEEIEMLFEPLYQRPTPSVHANRSHLGLGLFIARQIARAHGGDVTGTCSGSRVCFTIELPKAFAPPTDGPSP